MFDRHKREAFTSLFMKNSTKTPIGIRPPYAKEASLFLSVCATCNDAPCVRVCEEEIIVLGTDKTPSLLFTQSGCTFCKKCAHACPLDVLSLEAQEIIHALFTIDTQGCIAWNGVVCCCCLDVCEPKAITFFGMFRPVVQRDVCTGCGLCYSVCPSNAVQYHSHNQGG